MIGWFKRLWRSLVQPDPVDLPPPPQPRPQGETSTVTITAPVQHASVPHRVVVSGTATQAGNLVLYVQANDSRWYRQGLIAIAGSDGSPVSWLAEVVVGDEAGDRFFRYVIQAVLNPRGSAATKVDHLPSGDAVSEPRYVYRY